MLTIKDLFDLNDTIAAPLFEGKTYAWEVLGELSDYIKTLGATLSLEEYDRKRCQSVSFGLPRRPLHHRP